MHNNITWMMEEGNHNQILLWLSSDELIKHNFWLDKLIQQLIKWQQTCKSSSSFWEFTSPINFNPVTTLFSLIYFFNEPMLKQETFKSFSSFWEFTSAINFNPVTTLFSLIYFLMSLCYNRKHASLFLRFGSLLLLLVLTR